MRRRNRQIEGGGQGVNLNLIVTPFLDFSFQLLFLFICVYQPSFAMEGQIQMRLPLPAEPKGDAQAPSTGDEDPKLEPEVTVVVKIQEGGGEQQIKQLLIVREGKSSEVKDRNLKELTARLKEIRPKLTNQDDIKLQGDRKLKWANMVSVVDACREAGFKNPAFQAPSDEGQ